MKKIIKAFSLILVIACISNKTSAQLASETPAPTSAKAALTTTSKIPDVQTASSVAPGKTKTNDATLKPVVTNNEKPATLASSDDGLSQPIVKQASKAADKKPEVGGSLDQPVIVTQAAKSTDKTGSVEDVPAKKVETKPAPPTKGGSLDEMPKPVESKKISTNPGNTKTQ